MVWVDARAGSPVTVMKRELVYTPHMMRAGKRWAVQGMLYAAEPWGIISSAVETSAATRSEKEAGLSFVRQAREYFDAADRAAAIETKPLLYYYCFLNLAKAISMARGRLGLVGKISHGVHVVGGVGHTSSTAKIEYERSSANRASAVEELLHALEGNQVPTGPIAIEEILPQSVVAHRLWCEASKSRRERFLTIESVRFLEDSSKKEVWSRITVPRDVLRMRGWGLKAALAEAGLEPDYRIVKEPEAEARGLVTFEQSVPRTYAGRPSDVVMEIVDSLRPKIWQTITSAAPYRGYYLYLSQVNRLPQWLSVYSILFWLGSLTRYQPVELFDLLNGPEGPFFREFIATQPNQLLYMLTSEAKRQDVTRAAII